MQHLREKLLEQSEDGLLQRSRSPLRAELSAIARGERPVICHAVLALSQTITALGIVYLKRAMNEAVVDSVTFSFWRFVGATPCLLAVAVVWRQAWVVPSRADLAWFALLGGFLVLNQLFANLGVQLAGAVAATSMQPATPVVSALLAVGMGQERLSTQVVAGIGLAVTGALVVAVGRGDGSGARGNVPAGFACLSLNTTAFAAYCVCMKKVVHKHGAIAVTGASQALGLLFMSALVAARPAVMHDAPGLRLPPAAYGTLAYWVVMISVVGYLLISWANRHLPASTVALYAGLQPAVGAALSVLLLGDGLRPTDLGALGIVLGLAVIVKRDTTTSAP